jgi:KDO2-lipid IV(A) lauroyltransferase
VSRKKRAPLQNWAEYLAVRQLECLLHCLGARTVLSVGRLLGAFLWRADRRHVRIAEANLGIAFPHWPAGRIRKTARDCFEHLGMVLTEILYLPRLLKHRPLESWMEIEGGEHLARLPEREGLILVSGHVGHWEMSGWASARLARLARGLHAIARPLDNPLLDRLLARIRNSMGQRIVEKYGALRRMSAVVRSGDTLGVLMDQDARSEGVFVDFFGRPASTVGSVAALAAKHGAWMVPVCCVRVSRAPHYRFRILPPLRPVREGDRETALRANTRAVNAAIEEMIRAFPEQWLWMHRRWKTKKPACDRPHATCVQQTA